MENFLIYTTEEAGDYKIIECSDDELKKYVEEIERNGTINLYLGLKYGGNVEYKIFSFCIARGDTKLVSKIFNSEKKDFDITISDLWKK